MKNSSKSGVKRLKYSRITSQKINKILKCFCEYITACAAANLTGVNRNTVNRCYNEIRTEIIVNSLRKAVCSGGEFKLDESCFGAKIVRGKSGKESAEKTPVFGVLKRGGKVFVTIVKIAQEGS